MKPYIEALTNGERKYFKGGSTKDPERRIRKRIMEEAFMAGHNVKSIAGYFGYSIGTMSKYIVVKKLKKKDGDFVN